ncbi:MAG: hypothetical protein Q9224_002788 [Gallowayella concinna]
MCKTSPLLSLLFCILTITFGAAIPLFPLNHPKPSTLSVSNPHTSPNPLSLDIRMRALLEIKARNSDPIVRGAFLVGIALRSPNGQPSIDLNSFRHLTVIFHLRTPPPRPGVRENVFFKSEDGLRWQQSILREQPEADWYRLTEFQWGEVQSQMSLEEADGRIKAAGYVSPIKWIYINRSDQSPLSYCFPMIGQRTPCVKVSTGEVYHRE